MEDETFNGTRMAAGVPDAKDSAILAFDALLTLLQLGKAEAAQALEALPQWFAVMLCRLPALLLTWISFGVVVACAIYALTASLVLSALGFFLLQLGVTLLLEQRSRRLRERMAFVQTRMGFVALQASVKERFGHGAG